MDLVYHPYSADCTPSQAINTRLHEIISRVGEICLSSELAHVMLFPAQARAHQSGLTSSADFPDAHRATACDPVSVLSIMSDAPLTGHAITQAGKFLSRFQQDILPEPITTQHRQPIHICAWKLDLPSRVCLYTGEHPKDPSTLDLSSFMPHTLSKVLLEERSRRQDPSRFHILQDPGSLSADAIRTSLLHYAQTALTPHKARIPGIAQQALDHTLEEAVACLVQAPTRNHTTIALNQSPPWDKDHIDSRCVNEGRGFNQCIWTRPAVTDGSSQLEATVGQAYGQVERSIDVFAIPFGKEIPVPPAWCHIQLLAFCVELPRYDEVVGWGVLLFHTTERVVKHLYQKGISLIWFFENGPLQFATISPNNQ
jgi:hypothetical protein